MCKSPNILAQIREDLIGIRDLSGRIRTLHANTSQATTDMEHILCRARILEPAEELVGIAKRLTEQYSTSFNEIIGSEIRRLASVTTELDNVVDHLFQLHVERQPHAFGFRLETSMSQIARNTAKYIGNTLDGFNATINKFADSDILRFRILNLSELSASALTEISNLFDNSRFSRRFRTQHTSISELAERLSHACEDIQAAYTALQNATSKARLINIFNAKANTTRNIAGQICSQIDELLDLIIARRIQVGQRDIAQLTIIEQTIARMNAFLSEIAGHSNQLVAASRSEITSHNSYMRLLTSAAERLFNEIVVNRNKRISTILNQRRPSMSHRIRDSVALHAFMVGVITYLTGRSTYNGTSPSGKQ